MHPSASMSGSATGGIFRNVLRTITDREWKSDAVVFILYFATAKLAQYVLYTLETSPALIWAPAGVALAAVLLKGNKMWVPIALAHASSILTLNVIDIPLVNLIVSTLGHTVQPLVGSALLRKLRSDGTIHRTRDVLVFVGSAFIISVIAPLISTLGQLIFDTLRSGAWLTFSRTWAGSVFGILIMTPLLTGWYYSPYWPVPRRQLGEAVAAFGLLILSIYTLFWISIPSLVFAFIFLLCVTLFWIAFRFGSRVNTSGLFLLSLLGILGSIVAHPSAAKLNTQLFADELFIILIAPIFLLFFAVMEERRLAEKSLAEKVNELEEITAKLSSNDQAKNEFIAILAHELRNPLSTVVTTLELLKIENPGAESADLISRAEQQTLGMRRLLDDLLDVARIAEKKFNIVREGADLSTVVTRSVDATAATMQERQQTLNVTMPDARIPLYVDPIRIEQVIVNLLTNAAKYTPVGGTISLEAHTKAGAFELVVKDNGKGIPPERLNQIFLPFQQLGPSPHRSSGIGIGLFLTRQIVEMHDGTIHAESVGVGKGSTFIVRIPMNADWVKPVPVSKDGDMSAEFSKKKILVVDDNEAAAIGMRKLLTHHGHDVREVHSGAHAMQHTDSFAPDVVLLDIGLPDMSGHDVARNIRGMKLAKQPILIALTGYGQDSDRKEALAAGFDLHLTKPVGSAEIAEALASLSESARE